MATETVTDPFAASPAPLARLAGRFGFTEGQVWSLSIGLVITVLLLAAGLPDVAWRSPALTELAQAPVQDAPAVEKPPPAGIVPRLVPFEPETPASTQSSPPIVGPPALTTPTTTPPPTAGSTLRVVSGGFASSTAGTPLAATGLPDGVLAIAMRGGSPDKVAFIRLAGEGDRLDLPVDETPGSNVLDALAGLLLCPVLDEGWDVGQGDTSLEDAPAFDCTDGIAGARSESGLRWTFDLRAIAERTPPGGFAIVPDPASTSPVFQVVLKGPTPEEEP